MGTEENVLVGTFLAVVIVSIAILAAVFWINAPGPGRAGGASCDLSSLSWSPNVTTAGNETMYNYAVEGPLAGPWNVTTIYLASQQGSNISTTGPGWNLDVLNGSAVVATYDLQSPAPMWIKGGNTLPAAGEQLVLITPATVDLAGDTLWISWTGSCKGALGLEFA